MCENSVFDVWNSEKIKELQNATWGEKEECMSCNINKYCVRSPGIAYVENNSNLAKLTSACAIAKIREACN